MPTLYITEEEFTRDVHNVLEKAREGTEVFVQRMGRDIAVIRPPADPNGPGRPIADVIADLQKGPEIIPDDEFGKDLEEVIRYHQHPTPLPEWD